MRCHSIMKLNDHDIAVSLAPVTLRRDILTHSDTLREEHIMHEVHNCDTATGTLILFSSCYIKF
jgi:hypothetical protein